MNDLANYSDELIRLGKPDTKHMDLTADGLDILDDTVSLAEFTAERARIGKENENHISLTADGLDVLDDGVSLASFSSDGARIGANNAPNIQLADGKIKIYKQSSSDIEPVAIFGRGAYEALDPDIDGLRLNGLLGANSAIIGIIETNASSTQNLIMPLEGFYGIKLARGGIQYAEDGTPTFTPTIDAYSVLDQEEEGLNLDTYERAGATRQRWTFDIDGHTILPRPLAIAQGGTGQAATTKTTTVADIISTASPSITISAASFAKWGNMAQVTITFTVSDGLAANAAVDVGTIVSGKRPTVEVAGGSHSLAGYMQTGGLVQVRNISGSSQSGSSSRKIAFTYLLA